MPHFAAWESFYVIVGSSAGALRGLQFVVITLGAEKRAGDTGTTRAFGTPTIVHFCAVLLISAILSAPWPAVFGAAALLAGCGVAGVIMRFGRARGIVRARRVYVAWRVSWKRAGICRLECRAVP